MEELFHAIEPHTRTECQGITTDQGCYWHCTLCDYDRHQCGGCGEELSHLGNNRDGTPHVGCTD